MLMETRSLEELQDLLDQKRIELAYITAFKSYIKDENKINQAIRDRDLFSNPQNPTLNKTVNCIELMKDLFDSKGQLKNPLPDGWTIDIARAGKETLEAKFLNNEKFSDVERIIIESIDSSAVNMIRENNLAYLEISPADNEENMFMKKDRKSLILANAHKSLSLNSVNKSFFINGELEISKVDRNARASHTIVLSLMQAESKYNREIGALDSEVKKIFSALYGELINLINKAHKKTNMPEGLLGELWSKMEIIEKNPNTPNRMEAMKVAIIECYVSASLQAKKESSLFKSVSLSGELKKFMIRKLNMSEEDITQRSDLYKKQGVSQSMALSHRS